MEAFAILVSLVVGIAFLVLPIVSLAVAASASSQVSQLRARIAVLERRAATPAAAAPVPEVRTAVLPPTPALPRDGGRGSEAVPVPVPVPVPEPVPVPVPVPVPEVEPVVPPTPALPRGGGRGSDAARPASPGFNLSPERLVVWFAAAAGGFALVLASLFAMAVAIDRGWLGPGTRVGVGLFLGSAAFSLGTLLRRRSPAVAAGLTGAGTTTTFAVLFAAHSLYDLIGSTLTFALMVALSLVTTLAAVRHRDRLLAWLGLVGGLLTPVLVSSGENRPIALFAYLGLLGASQLAAARIRGWWDTAAGMLAGTALLYLGWSAQWWAADQVPVALAGAFALSLPWMVVAALDVRDAPDQPAWSRPIHVRWVAQAATALFPLLALAWIVPVDPMFYDPRGGVSVARPLADALAFALAGTLLLPLPGWLAARRRTDVVATAVTAGVAGLLGFTFAAGWALVEGTDSWRLVAGAVGPLVVGALATIRSPARSGTAPLPLLAGIALSTCFVAIGPPYAVGLLAVVVVTATAGRQPLVVASGLLGTGFALAVGGGAAQEQPEPSILGVALLALGILGTFPLVRKGTVARGTDAGQRVAAFAGIALLPGLYLAWRAVVGADLMGPVPLIVGVVALLGAALAVRRHGARDDDLGLTVLVGIALFGVTAAIPAQLEEGWLTVSWAVQAAALAWLWGRLRHPLVPTFAVGLAVAVGVRLVLNPYALDYGDSRGFLLVNWPLYTWGVPFLALLATAYFLRRNARGNLFENAAAPILLLALLVGFALVNVEVSDLFQDAGPIELGGASIWQGMVRSVAWAGYGLLILAAGLWNDSRMVRFVGFFYVLLATAKVGIYDVWSLAGFVRVGSLVGLGLALIVVAVAFEWLVIRGGRSRRSAEEAA